MTDLIINISTGKGTWQHASEVIKKENWSKIFIITNDFGKEKFTTDKSHEFILIDTNRDIKEIREEIIKNLKEKIKDTEVALNLYSGTGKEHMAILSAILKLGLSLRIIIPTKDNIEEI